MNATATMPVGGVSTIYCPRCGKAMRIAPQHADVPVACPHCSGVVAPRRILPDGPPPLPAYVRPAAADSTVYSDRNRWVAGALGIFLGVFGVHRFYLGHVGLGVTQLVLGIFSLGIISAVWGFIDGILCFCGAIDDADGLPLSG